MAKELYLDFEGLQQYDAIVEEKIRRAVADAVGFEVVVVNSLPESGEEHILYLVPNTLNPNIHDEYLWVNNAWEKIGNTDIDLSQYATLAYVDENLEGKVDNSEFNEFSENVSTNLSAKTNKDYVDASLALKANAADLANYATNASLAEKQDVLNAGANIDINNGYVSALGYQYDRNTQSFVEGYTATATGWASHAEGENTSTAKWASHVEGVGTIATNDAEHAQGQYNQSNNGTIHSVGIGTSEERKNALEVLYNGNIFVNNVGNYNGTTIQNVSSLQEVVNAKQDNIEDLNNIRSLATSAVQPNDISTFITEDTLTQYATTEAVNTGLAEKADQEYVDASLANKADVVDLEALLNRISALESTIVVLKANIEQLDREVNAVSYDINEAIANIRKAGERTIYTDPEQRFIIDASTSTSKYTLTMLGNNELGNYVVPADIDKAITIDGSIKNGATITSESIKTVTINNKSNNPVDIAIISNGTVALTGNFNDVEFDDGALNGVGSEYANINGNVIISDNAAKATTINANFVGENNTVISQTSQAITINAKNEGANIAIECPNSTVTVNGNYDEVEANVADDTLKFTSLTTHINTLHLKHGNIFINNGKNVIDDLVGEIIADSSYTVDWNKATVLPNSPAACEYTLETDKTGSVTWGTFASGDTVINLNNHTIHNEGTDGRPTMNIRGTAHVEINGEGTVSNNKEYCIWNNSATAVTTINGGNYFGNTHVVYAYNGLVEIKGGDFELVGEYEKDPNGHAKFLLNCYDANYTAGTADIKCYGGRYYNFDPAVSYSEPGGPVSFIADGYESVCIDEANQIYEVRKL